MKPDSPIDNHVWICVYCGHEHDSPNCEGTDVVCCGEIGHSLRDDDPALKDIWPDDEEKTDE